MAATVANFGGKPVTKTEILGVDNTHVTIIYKGGGPATPDSDSLCSERATKMRAVAIAAAMAAVLCARPPHCASMIHEQLPAPPCVSAVAQCSNTALTTQDVCARCRPLLGACPLTFSPC